MITILADIPCGQAYCTSCPISDMFHDDGWQDSFGNTNTKKLRETLFEAGPISREMSVLICTKNRKYGK
jgi:hypothetical protein